MNQPATNNEALLARVSNRAEKQGLLEASILSVYDLPYSEPPVAVTLTACKLTVTSGAPVARHKDRNSFRFGTAPSFSDASTNNVYNTNNSTARASATAASTTSTTDATNTNNSNDVKLVAPLRDLYAAKLKICVVYQEKRHLLEAEYELKQLRVHESKWLILNLTNPLSQLQQEQQQSTTTTTTTTAITNHNGNTSSINDEMIPPTIRIKLHLSGPYRPEVAALVTICQTWFGFVDHVEDNTRQAWDKMPKVPIPVNPNYLLLPAVPVAAAVVVVSPVLAGVAMVGIPFFLPLILALVSVSAGLLVTGGVVYSSTQKGRTQFSGMVGPLMESFTTSRSGQALLYDIGPRPTPVSVVKQMVPRDIWMKLVLSLLIDLIGSSSYLLPVVGEGLDITWAPIQTIFVMAMYDTVTPNLKYISFAEEILPFTDIVPTATIGWACEFVPQLIGNNPNLVQVVNALVPDRTDLSAARRSTNSTTTTTTLNHQAR